MLETPRGWPAAVVGLVKTAAGEGRAGAIRDALGAIRALPATQQGPPFHLGICRTFTIEPQLDAMTLALATLPCRPAITVGDLENIEQLLLDPESPMLRTRLDALLVLWRLEELHPRLVYEYELMSSDERARAAADVISRVERLCLKYATMGSVPLFLSTLPESVASSAATHDVHSAHAPRRAVLRINHALLDMTTRNSLIHVFDFSGWAAREGTTAFDLKMDLYARQPIASRSLMSFSAALADGLRPLLQPASKVLAIDLDNVLWGGVLGEDGTDGLKIGHDFPGNIYRRIQQHCLALKHRGVLLVLLSKNNLADVEQAFATTPDMPLAMSDFAAVRVNWRDKGDNLKDVAQELDLGLDSFVFVDDQPFEREQMEFRVPEVRVLAASEDPLQTLRVLTTYRAFDVYRVSGEDRQRTADYAAQARRRELESKSQDGPDFLYTLQLQARITRVDEAMIPRVVQMLGKTSQFNVTTRRHSEADVRRMLADPANLMMALSLSDRFGDQGIVGLSIALADAETRTVKIDSFVLSCRAIGRRAEEALWSSVLSNLSRGSYTALHAEFVPTARNMQVADLFTRLGMIRQESRPDAHSSYRLDLPALFPCPASIAVMDETLAYEQSAKTASSPR